MNAKLVLRKITDVLHQFDLENRFDEFCKTKNPNEAELEQIAESLGITKRHLESGIAPIPDRIYRQYPLFNLLSSWNISHHLVGRYGSLRMLKAIFGDKCTSDNIPTKEEENAMLAASVRARCDSKVLRINELFPDTYPLDLPVCKFWLTTNEFISFPEVYAFADAFDAVIQRFSDLFFAAIQGDLPEDEACELNLLSTFLYATDVVMPSRSITYRHIQKYRVQMQAEGYANLESYVRIRRDIPFWMAREFYNDSDYFITYVETHAEVKEKIRRFLSLITSYECNYTFIKDMEEHLRLQKMTEEELLEEELESLGIPEDDLPEMIYIFSDPILVPKENDEITETDRFTVDRGQALLKRAHREYIPFIPDVMEKFERMKRRLELPDGTPAPLPDGRNPMEVGDDHA